MLDALKMSTEPKESIEAARNYLRGVIGDLVRKKKREKELKIARSRPILPTSLPISGHRSQSGPDVGQLPG